jgi:ADP-ribose pyrophosphatase
MPKKESALDDEQLPKWHVAKSEYLINDRWLKVRSETCITPEGHTIDPYYVLEYNDYIACVVIDDQNDVIMLRHYRHGAGDYILEVVGGIIEDSDASPLDTTLREIKEELGYGGGQVYQTGVSYTNPAMMTNKVYCFLAIGGACQHQPNLQVGENFKVEKMPFGDFVKLFTRPNDILCQSLYLTSIFFALNFIKNSTADELAELRRLLAAAD